MIHAGLKEPNEDEQEMETCTTSSQEAGPVESYNSYEQGKIPKSLITGILNGVCNEETVNFKDDGLFMMPPLFTCPISDKHCRMIIVSLFFVRATLRF